MIYLFSDFMTEWNNDQISKLIDFTEKRCMLSAIFLVQETVMNLHQIFHASFCYQFLVPVSVACVAGFSPLPASHKQFVTSLNVH